MPVVGHAGLTDPPVSAEDWKAHKPLFQSEDSETTVTLKPQYNTCCEQLVSPSEAMCSLLSLPQDVPTPNQHQQKQPALIANMANITIKVQLLPVDLGGWRIYGPSDILMYNSSTHSSAQSRWERTVLCTTASRRLSTRRLCRLQRVARACRCTCRWVCLGATSGSSGWVRSWRSSCSELAQLSLWVAPGNIGRFVSRPFVHLIYVSYVIQLIVLFVRVFYCMFVQDCT